MPRIAPLKSLQALTKLNITKSLNKLQLTKEEYNELLKISEEYIKNATIDDLRQKGIINVILQHGGMKRARDDNEPIEPSKRSFLRRAVGTLIGDPFNEDEYNQKQHEEKLKQLFIIEKWAKLIMKIQRKY